MLYLPSKFRASRDDVFSRDGLMLRSEGPHG